jgi:AcrR family transcriptional regulator
VSDQNVIDGRTARRNRNRDAVLEAMIELTRETNREPAIEDIAHRAGVSYRSVYRYFDDRTDLMLAAIGRVMGDVWPIFDIERLGEGPLDQRISRLVASRVAAYRELAPLTRVVVRRASTDTTVLGEYDRVRAYIREQLEAQFAPELARIDPTERRSVVAAIDVMFQFEALDFLGRHDGMTDEAMSEVLERHIRGHLGAAIATAD